MKKKETKKITTSEPNKIYVVDRNQLSEQLSSNNPYNWIVSIGANGILDTGKMPGHSMITFLESLKVIK